MAFQNGQCDDNTLDTALQTVCKRFGSGFTLKPKQREALECIWRWNKLKKRDILINCPIGSGKSLIFQVLPELLSIKENRHESSSVVIVMCPLNLIQTDQMARLRNIGITSCRLDINGTPFTLPSGLLRPGPQREIEVKLDLVKEGKFSLIFAHPESLFSSTKGKELLQDDCFCSRVSATVIDECHKVAEWAKEFRTAFGDLDSLVTFFPNVPLVAMSGTLTNIQLKDIPRTLCLRGPVSVISANPDRPNIYLRKKKRESNLDVKSAFEEIFQPECQRLFEKGMHYPVTLLYMPMEYIAAAMGYISKLFGHTEVNIYDCRVMYAPVYSRLDTETLVLVSSELRKPSDNLCRIRLVFCTPAIGMGFDSPHILNVIHARPPQRMSDYFQEIGRAGRSRQNATATVWYNKSDLGIKGLSEDMKKYCLSEDECMRKILLAVFGFEKVESESARCCTVCLTLKQNMELESLTIG